MSVSSCAAIEVICGGNGRVKEWEKRTREKEGDDRSERTVQAGHTGLLHGHGRDYAGGVWRGQEGFGGKFFWGAVWRDEARCLSPLHKK